MTNQIKGVGILGAGRVSRDHAYAVKKINDLNLVAVADPDESRGRTFGMKWGCDTYLDHHELLTRRDIDLILAGLPHSLHGPVSIDVLNAGKHLLIEKPMATTLEACEAMIEAATRNRAQLMVGHTQHFFPANVAVKKLIDGGRIGPLVMATQWWYKPFGLKGRPSWMLDRSTGGGMWLMNGAHMLDLLIWLIGSDVVSVKANVTNRILNQNADDSVIAFVEFANGVCTTVSHVGTKRPDPPPFDQWMTTRVIGTEGSARVVSYQGEAYLNTDGDDQPILVERDAQREAAVVAFLNGEAGNPPETPIPQAMIEQTTGIVNELESFVGAIQSGAALPIGNPHSLAVMQVLLAVEESSETGREVRLAR